MNPFKRKYSPGGVLLTNTNCVYVSAAYGNDAEGITGYIDSPYQSLQEAINRKGSRAYICVDDSIYIGNIEALAIVEIFPNLNFFVIQGNVSVPSVNSTALNIHYAIIKGSVSIGFGNRHLGLGLFYCWVNELIGSDYPTETYWRGQNRNYIKVFKQGMLKHNSPGKFFQNNTFSEFYNYLQRDSIASDSIIIDLIDFYPRGSTYNVDIFPKFSYCLFRKQTAIKWDTLTIPITWSEDENLWIEDIKAGISYFGTNQAGLSATHRTYLQNIAANTFQNGCRVMDDSGDVRLFNRYNHAGQPVDFTLNVHLDNIAIRMSEFGSYVGAFAPNIGGMLLGDIVNINEDGTINAAEPTLLVNNDDGTLEANELSSQRWNRVVTNLLFSQSKNFAFRGLQCLVESGRASGYNYGKLYADKTISVDTIEVVPYDDETTPSAFPPFSCALIQETYMYYHTQGQPVLFSDLAGLGVTANVSLAIYGSYAVTDADYDSIALLSNSNVILKQIPIKFFKLEINLHYAYSDSED